jgi:hypothetical protein
MPQQRPLLEIGPMSAAGLERWFWPPLCGYKKVSILLSAAGREQIWQRKIRAPALPLKTEIAFNARKWVPRSDCVWHAEAHS